MRTQYTVNIRLKVYRMGPEFEICAVEEAVGVYKSTGVVRFPRERRLKVYTFK